MFKDLDIYKVILLLSILLVPAAWGYASHLDGKWEEAQKKHRLALRDGGVVYEIGRLAAQLESIKKNVGKDGAQEPKLYFDNQVQSRRLGGQIKSTWFTVTVDDQTRRFSGRSSRSGGYVDVTAKIDFIKRVPGQDEDLALNRDYISGLIFNCELEGLQIWKLRRLTMENAALSKFKEKDIPPKTVPDQWVVRTLEFARRKPDSL